MAIIRVETPQEVQIPASDTSSRVVNPDASESYTLKMLTPTGTAGSVTVRKGAVTTHTRPN